MPLVMVHRLSYGRFLVFYRRVVVSTIIIMPTLLCLRISLGYIFAIYTHVWIIAIIRYGREPQQNNIDMPEHNEGYPV